MQIVLYRSGQKLPSLLTALDRLDTDDAELRLAFLNHSPEDGCESLIRGHEFAVPCTYAGPDHGNRGFAAGHNYLSRSHATRSDYLLFLNPDTIPFSDMVSELVKVGVSAPRAALVEAAQFPVEHQKCYDAESGHTDWCCATSLLVRSAVFHELGGFDERLFLYCEDVDLSWRAWLAGYTCVYAATAKCVHVSQEDDLGKDRAPEIYHMELGNLYLRNKYFGEASVRDHFEFLRDRVSDVALERLRGDLSRIAHPHPLRVSHPRVALNPDHVNYGPTRW